LKADKGFNTVICNVEVNDREAKRQLSDQSTYRELSQKEFTEKSTNIKQTSCSISENLFFPSPHYPP
jgi:hypothetical protein